MSLHSVAVIGALALGVSLGHSCLSLAKETQAKMPDFVKICSKECPEAKTNEAAIGCVESKMKDPTFKKTKCSMEHSKYEKAGNGRHDEHSHAHEGEKH